MTMTPRRYSASLFEKPTIDRELGLGHGQVGVSAPGAGADCCGGVGVSLIEVSNAGLLTAIQVGGQCDLESAALISHRGVPFLQSGGTFQFGVLCSKVSTALPTDLETHPYTRLVSSIYHLTPRLRCQLLVDSVVVIRERTLKAFKGKGAMVHQVPLVACGSVAVSGNSSIFGSIVGLGVGAGNLVSLAADLRSAGLEGGKCINFGLAFTSLKGVFIFVIWRRHQLWVRSSRVTAALPTAWVTSPYTAFTAHFAALGRFLDGLSRPVAAPGTGNGAAIGAAKSAFRGAAC